MAKESNRELKKQLAEAREDIQQLMLELGKVNKTANTSYEQSPAYLASQNQIKRLEEQNKALEQKNKRLQEENRKLRSQTEPVHNARGAGRKKNDAAWIKKYVEFCSLVKDGKTMADIMGTMQISRSTYFRFMKSYKEDLELDDAIDTAQEEIRKKNKVSKNNK